MAHKAGTLTGTGILRRGDRVLDTVQYVVHLSGANGQAKFVEFHPKPTAKDGDLVHLTLEDGRVLNCTILDDSPYCAVVGDGPIVERRRHVRDVAAPRRHIYQ
jgi:hypothetical protein